MDEAEQESIIRLAAVRRIPRSEPAFRQGEPARYFYLLICGRLKVIQTTEDGQQVVVRIVHPGELFGIANALRRSDYPGTATAIVDSVALAWSSTLWNDMTRRHPSLMMCAMYTVSRHLQESHARIRELSTEDVERRIAHALVRLVAQAGRPTEDGLLIDFPITRQDIAELTGTTIPTVSRILTAWTDKGLVEAGRLRIVIREPQRLSALAQE